MVNKNISKTVCHLSFTHSLFDDRIYWKELLSLKKAGYQAIHIAAGEKNDDFITNEGIRIIIIKRKRLSTTPALNKFLQLVFKTSGTLGDMLKKAKEVNADVYHYHDLQINAISGELKKFPQNPRVIYDVHEALYMLPEENLSSVFFKKSLYKFYFQKKLQWQIKKASVCDHIIATDLYTLNYFEKKLPQVPKSIVFNYSFFVPSEIQYTVKKEYHFIYAGYISRERGIFEMIRGINLVKSDFPAVKLLLIGPFENEKVKKEVLQVIIDLTLQDNVVIQNPVPFEEIHNYYQRSMAGLGLFHNTPKYNNFIPIKLFEYMAFGLPVIFSDLGPSAEIIKETNCGVLVAINDMDISGAMKKLMEDVKYFNELSENGKSAVETKYNWKNEEQKLITLYENLIK